MKEMKGLIRQWVGVNMTILIVLLLATSSWGAAPEPQRGGVLKIIAMSEGGMPIGAPWAIWGVEARVIVPAVESLLWEDSRGEYHPWLATGWTTDPAKKTITLSLRKDVKFHDGTDFNAKAAKWCLDQAINAKIISEFLKVDVVDDYTIRVNLTEYNNTLLKYLATSYGAGLVSPTAYEKKGKDWAMWNPVGTGPFKFVNFVRGSKLTYARWEGYWQKGKPYLDGLEYHFIRDPMTQQAAMRTSGPEKVHVLSVTSGEEAAMMKAQGFKVLSRPGGPVSLLPDSIDPNSPLSKKKVREAVSYAIDRDAIVKARGFGFWLASNQIPGSDQVGYVKNLPLGQYDPKKAKQLLAEAGYPNGFSTKIIVMPGMVDRDVMVAVQRFLGEVGIKVELEFPDTGAYTTYRLKQPHHGFLAHRTRMNVTTNLTYENYWRSGSQFPGLKRTEGLLDKLKASLATPTQEVARAEELTRMQAEDVMFIPIYDVCDIYILQPNVRYPELSSWAFTSAPFRLEDVWLSK